MIIQYYTQQEKEDLIDLWVTINGHRLLEEQLHVNGNFLIFSDPPLPITIDKTTMLADKIDTITVSGLPFPSKVIIDEQEFQVIDGEFSFTVDTIGEYLIQCYSEGYLSKEHVINAN